jgi:hypothetical protein
MEANAKRSGGISKNMPDNFILTINAGSSSLKFALFRATRAPARELAGKFERIGLLIGYCFSRAALYLTLRG